MSGPLGHILSACTALTVNRSATTSGCRPAPALQPRESRCAVGPRATGINPPGTRPSVSSQYQVSTGVIGVSRVISTPAQTEPGQQRRTCEEPALGTVLVESGVLQLVYDHLRVDGQCLRSAELCPCIGAAFTSAELKSAESGTIDPHGTANLATVTKSLIFGVRSSYSNM